MTLNLGKKSITVLHENEVLLKYFHIVHVSLYFVTYKKSHVENVLTHMIPVN